MTSSCIVDSACWRKELMAFAGDHSKQSTLWMMDCVCLNIMLGHQGKRIVPQEWWAMQSMCVICSLSSQCDPTIKYQAQEKMVPGLSLLVCSYRQGETISGSILGLCRGQKTHRREQCPWCAGQSWLERRAAIWVGLGEALSDGGSCPSLEGAPTLSIAGSLVEKSFQGN